MIAVLLQLTLLFGGLSLLAFGGGTAVLPDMQRAAVDTYHWMTAPEFLAFFAISRAAPGPGSLIVVLIGQKVAGLVGATVALVAMFGPYCRLGLAPACGARAGTDGHRPDLRQRHRADARHRA